MFRGVEFWGIEFERVHRCGVWGGIRQEAEREEREKARRRSEILETLRRLKDEADDPALVQARERERRHAELLERYPPLY